MQMIVKKIIQVQHMVEHLFEISKIEARIMSLKKKPFVLSEVVQEIVKYFSVKFKRKKVSLKCIQCQYLSWINADISLMERVVQNLVDNVRK